MPLMFISKGASAGGIGGPHDIRLMLWTCFGPTRNRTKAALRVLKIARRMEELIGCFTHDRGRIPVDHGMQGKPDPTPDEGEERERGRERERQVQEKGE
jgi:hypothetical protein